MDVQLRIRRYNPEADDEPHWEEYTVPAGPTECSTSCTR
jgi:succinate dehydrogenase/fumarate reductase-like Fe-S protein